MACLSGQAAEDQVAAFLVERGHEVIARRWRGTAGEIDLICTEAAVTVFVEVKRAATHAAAAQRLSHRQSARIRTAAGEFAAGLPAGQDSDMRFDVAMVDSLGRIEIIENALGP